MATRTATERLLLRLEWQVLRRLDGRIAGGYRTAHRGGGIDLAGLRDYAEGDDARHIDWNVTARLNEPQLRVFNEDRELTVWLVLDRSASMTVGAPGRGKHEVLSELALVVARLFTRSGNRVGALLYDTGPAGTGAVRTVPPATGRSQVLRIGAELARTAGERAGTGRRPRRPPAGLARQKRRRQEQPGQNTPGTGTRTGTGTTGRERRDNARRGSGNAVAGNGTANGRNGHGGRGAGATTDLAAMLDAVAKLARRRALIVVISDFIGEGDWERSLLRLAPRHEVVVLRVTDAADEELPDAGLVVVEDAETGEQLLVDSGDPLLRARLRAAVAEREARLAEGTRRAGVPVHRIDTPPTWQARLSRSSRAPSAGAHEHRRPRAARPRPAGGRVPGGAAVTIARRRTAALAAAGVAAGSGRGRLAGAWCTIAGIAVLALAVAGPTVSVPVSHAKGTVVLAVDVSGSMAATDVAPSRLAAAKRAAEAFIDAQPGSVDIGVVAFEEGGIETAIPSCRSRHLGGRRSPAEHRRRHVARVGHRRRAVRDHPQDRHHHARGERAGHRVLALGHHRAVLRRAGRRRRKRVGRRRRPGQRRRGGGGGPDVDAGIAATVAEQAGVHIDTVGVGTATGTTVEADGYHLFTALDAATLKSISQATGGSYHPASNASELNGIASSINLRLTVSREPLPLAGALIALALALLAAGAVLTVARTGRVI